MKRGRLVFSDGHVSRSMKLRAVAPEVGCVNCGSNVVGDFCAGCGQRPPRPDDYTMRTLARAAVGHLTNYDARLWKTVKTLFVRPGQLARDHYEGRRARHLDPFRIFVLANVFAWFVVPYTHMRGFILKVALERALGAPLWLRAMALRARLGHVTVEELAKRIDAVSASENSVGVLCLVPLLALGVWATVAGRKYRYVHHLVFAAHFYCIHLLWCIAYLGFGLTWIARDLLLAHASTLAIGKLMITPWAQHLAAAPALIPYLYLGLMRAYELSPRQAGWRAVVLGLWACTLARAFYDIVFALVLVFA